MNAISPASDPTRLARRRYDRIAPVYDLLEAPAELVFRGWRRALWGRVPGGQVLEVGVGTGKNLRFHPPKADVTAIDFSEAMLAHARRRADALDSTAQLLLADVQALPFADHTFDVAVASFVFCSVPDAALGLAELHRVVRPGGRLLLLEHVLPSSRPLASLCDALDPLVARVWGAHINRPTTDTVRRSPWRDCQTKRRLGSLVVQIEAERSG